MLPKKCRRLPSDLAPLHPGAEPAVLIARGAAQGRSRRGWYQVRLASGTLKERRHSAASVATLSDLGLLSPGPEPGTLRLDPAWAALCYTPS